MRSAFLLLPLWALLAACPGPGGDDSSTTDGGGNDGGGSDAGVSDGGGGDSGNTDGGSSATVIVFESPRALDGSDAVSPNGVYNIWSVNPDGSNLHPLTQLTASNTDCESPAWSPDGTKIAFVSTRKLDGSDAENARPADAGTSSDAQNIWIMNADGSSPKPLTTLTISSCQAPRWSPDVTKILFNSDRPASGMDGHPNTTNAWIMDADGNNQTPLTQFVSTVTTQPALSPDGGHILYLSQGALNGSDSMIAANNVWMMNANITSPAPLTQYTAAGAFLAGAQWSKDNTTILYTSNALLNGTDGAMSGLGHNNIWTVAVSSQTKTPLTNFTTAAALLPVYSPDGTKIVYQSTGTLDGHDTLNANNTGNIWVMDANGSSPTALTKNQNVSYDYPYATWSKDGALIAFSSERKVDGSDAVSPNEVTNLWVMNADGSNLHALTTTTVSGADCDGASFRP